MPFKKGEVLTVLSKDEEQWWTARNSLGKTGSIPVPYIQKVMEGSKLIVEKNRGHREKISTEVWISKIGIKTGKSYQKHLRGLQMRHK